MDVHSENWKRDGVSHVVEMIREKAVQGRAKVLKTRSSRVP
jgi:hypothetical protein